MKAGDVFSTRFNGDIEVISYNGSMDVDIKFIDTGYEVKTRAHSIRLGNIKDRLLRSCYGVGYHGIGKYSANRGSKIYSCWLSMLQRCYDQKYQKISPTYIGCSVFEEWQDYQNFASWHEENHPNDGKLYHLDKDIIVDGNKLYGPNTCKFVSPYENAIASIRTMYEVNIINTKTGEKITIKNQAKFCRDNELNNRNFNQMVKGKRKSCGKFKMERAK